MMITHEQKAEKIKSRLLAHIDEFALLLASGQKLTIVPTRTTCKVFSGRETRLNLDDNRGVGGADNE